MKLLLDTHIWLWSLLDPDRLSRSVYRILSDPASEVWLSPISTWEAMMLCSKGRLTLQEEPEAWVVKALTAGPIIQAPLTHEIAIASAGVRLPHRDPADHLIVATAKVLGLTLVTADANLISARQVPILANRRGVI